MENALTTIKNIHDSLAFQLQIDKLLFGDIVILLNEDGVETEVLLENLTEDLANHFAGFAIPLQGKNHLVTNILLSLSKEDLIHDSFEKAQENALKVRYAKIWLKNKKMVYPIFFCFFLQTLIDKTSAKWSNGYISTKIN